MTRWMCSHSTRASEGTSSGESDASPALTRCEVPARSQAARLSSTVAGFVNGRSIFNCPTAAVTPRDPAVDPDPFQGPAFHYGINARINYPAPAETPFRISWAANPSAFVVFSEQRAHSRETPYIGKNPTDVSSSYNFTTRFSGRHGRGGNIVFGDAHAAWFRYDYVCVLRKDQPADPGRPDIHWAASGQQIP